MLLHHLMQDRARRVSWLVAPGIATSPLVRFRRHRPSATALCVPAPTVGIRRQFCGNLSPATRRPPPRLWRSPPSRIELSVGSVVIRKEATVGFYRQSHEVPAEGTVLDALLSGFEDVLAIRHELERARVRAGDQTRQIGVKFDWLNPESRAAIRHQLRTAPPLPPNPRPGRRDARPALQRLGVGSGWARSNVGHMLTRWSER